MHLDSICPSEPIPTLPAEPSFIRTRLILPYLPNLALTQRNSSRPDVQDLPAVSERNISHRDGTRLACHN
jgi:hypothetical protein